MDSFFTKRTCDQCGGDLKSGRTMSAFSTQAICIPCSEQERADPNYQKAKQAELAEIKRGNYNYSGLRGDRR